MTRRDGSGRPTWPGTRGYLPAIAAAAVSVAMHAPIASGQGYAPADAAARMECAAGLEARLVAAEPDVRQAIFAKCDARGRLWTIQYLQYPNPEGLERVKVDRWSRTQYDRVPEPPPRGPRGNDRITICEDVDGDGRADRFRDFVDGLNLATGVEFGHGGVYVLNVPYLLFYPDRDKDDVPDGDPEVLLSGFGMEDAQSLSNHLTWGPDGWLYGVNGSTTTCRVGDVEFQSGVWRYHPLTKEFELFSEGGYNCFGLTFDRHGELFCSTNGGPFIHAMQGAYYYKTFGKHGPLHNLYAYHHFPILQCDSVPGGPPTGGTIYRGDSFPQRFRDTFIAGNFLGHTVSWWRVIPRGSTFVAEFGGVLADSHDTWFGPTDLCVGPNGGIFVSDFHDHRTAHPDPDAEWDRRNGRVFEIKAPQSERRNAIDIGGLPTDALVDLFDHPNGWFADRARVELAGRRDASVAARLAAMARQVDDPERALQGVWGLHAIGRFDDAIATESLSHPAPAVRKWAVRLLGDRRTLTPGLAAALLALAGRETEPVPLAQLAASAKRLPPEQGVPIAVAALGTEAGRADDRIPWLAWWALENAAITAPALLLQTFGRPDAWTQPALRDNALRLLRRWSADGSAVGYDACAEVLVNVPEEYRTEALRAIRQGLAERGTGLHGIGQGDLYASVARPVSPTPQQREFHPVGGPLQEALAAYWHGRPSELLALELAIRSGVPGSVARLLAVLDEPAADDGQRIAQLRLLRESGSLSAAAVAIRFLERNVTECVVLEALETIDARGDAKDVAGLVARYAEHTPPTRSRLRDMFFSRPGVALEFLRQIDAGTFAAAEVPVSQLAALSAHDNAEIDALVMANWGRIGIGTAEEKLATMRRLANDLRAGNGDATHGKPLFVRHCGGCHKLFGEGAMIGPELTGANRHDTNALLANLVDPSAVIRNDYLSYTVVTQSGRAVTGMLAEQDAARVTVVDAQSRRLPIDRADIDSIDPSPVSLMPEKLLEQLSAQELRDLFAYLQQ